MATTGGGCPVAASAAAGNSQLSTSAAPTTEGLRLIPDQALAENDPALASMLGKWWQDTARLTTQFTSSGAVPHVVIDNFFEHSFACQLAAEFPDCNSSLWHVYDNPLEKKRACNDTTRMPSALRKALLALCGPAVVKAMRAITGVSEAEVLQADPYCHGGGLHSHGSGDKLDLHLDYSLHPVSGLERRFNLIVYLVAESWEEAYGGALELRGASAEDAMQPGEPSAIVPPKFNRALLFSTTAPSFHGFPTPLACPPSARRNSLALYYLTPPRAEAPARFKALYVPPPGQAHDPLMARLRAIRAERRLYESDLVGIRAWEGLVDPGAGGGADHVAGNDALPHAAVLESI
mmetsp:Transcript_24937/g.63504  ORF Transcript_24937/g.63504 Transcript_24937/m.63504 type:complete len:349 (-) Transcript_24937:71-1117(-)